MIIKYSNEPPLLFQMYSAWAGMGAMGFMSPNCGFLGAPALFSGPHWLLLGVWPGARSGRVLGFLVSICSTNRRPLNSCFGVPASVRRPGRLWIARLHLRFHPGPLALVWMAAPLCHGHRAFSSEPLTHCRGPWKALTQASSCCIRAGAASPRVCGDLPLRLGVSPGLPLDFSLSRAHKHV